MKGATEYYNIIKNASYKKLGNLKNLGSWYGGDSEAYIHDNIIFVTSSHARGECFHILLIEDSIMSKDQLKSNAFEVYGILGGQSGWTEFYGWKHEGKWVEPIMKYLNDLKEEIQLYDEKIQKEKQDKEDAKNKEIEMKVNHFNQIFA